MFALSLLNPLYLAWAAARALLCREDAWLLPLLLCHVRMVWRDVRRWIWGPVDFTVTAAYLLPDADGTPAVPVCPEARLPRTGTMVVFYTFGPCEQPYAVAIDLAKFDPLRDEVVPYLPGAAATALPRYLSLEFEGEDFTELVARYAGPKNNYYADVPYAAQLQLADMVDERGRPLFDGDADHVLALDADLEHQHIKLRASGDDNQDGDRSEDSSDWEAA